MKMTIKQITGLASAVLLVLTIAACGSDHDNTGAKDARPVVKATLAKAGGGTAGGTISLSGKIQAADYANVSARIMGYLTNVSVNVGDRVRKGQLLATIQSDELQAKVAQAEAGISEAKAALANIEKDYKRIQSLFEKKSATQKELDDITAARNMTMAKLEQAEQMKKEVNTMLSYARITSPYNGVITEKYVNSGDLATPGKPLFAIEAGGDFQAEVMVPESRIASIEKGEPVEVILKNNGKKIKGVIGEYSSSSLHTGGQYLAKIDFDPKDVKDVKLYSGMYVNVLLPEKEKSGTEDKVLVNHSAVVEQGQLTGIYTVSEENTAILRWVRLGKTYGDKVEVLSGLAAGEDYISGHDGRLMNGVKVEVR